MIKCIYRIKPNILQYQIPDFWGDIIITEFDMNDPKQYREARKALLPRRNKKKCRRKKRLDSKRFKRITSFIIFGKTTVSTMKYFLRFRNITTTNPSSDDSHLKPYEVLLYQEVAEFHGFFEDLFLCNDMVYIGCIEAILANIGDFKCAPTLHDMFIYEFTRIQTGHQNYSAFIRNLNFFNPFFFQDLLDTPNFRPNIQDFSRMYHSVPVRAFQDFFLFLLDEIIKLHLISFKILIWDCQFIHSNASDYKDRKSGSYSDPDAGIGRHSNKFLGLGYMASTIYVYCNHLIIPVYCLLFPANYNDKTIFYETMQQYFTSTLPKPEAILGDAGAYSLKNLEFLAMNDVIPVINEPKNIKNQNVVELRNDVHLNRDYLPKIWSDDELLKLYAIRTSIERLFSRNIQIYNARRLNIRGIEEATKHRLMILILDLLKTLTCYKLGRTDLYLTFTAFSTTRQGYIIEQVQKLLKKAGYNLFPRWTELEGI